MIIVVVDDPIEMVAVPAPVTAMPAIIAAATIVPVEAAVMARSGPGRKTRCRRILGLARRGRSVVFCESEAVNALTGKLVAKSVLTYNVLS